MSIRTSEFRAVGALLFERCGDIIHRIPVVPPTTSFPYRFEGEACFACESEGLDRAAQPDQARCPRCPNVRLTDLSGPALTEHVGAHILYDLSYKDADSPCGFCLQTGQTCSIYLRKGQSGLQIDTSLSRCPNLRKLSLKAAAKFSKHSPCTNHPLICPYCPTGSPSVWKYNLRSHIRTTHPTAACELSKHLYTIEEAEKVLMKGCWNKRTRIAKGKKKKIQNPTMAISEAHTTRVALRPSDSLAVAIDSENVESDSSESLHIDSVGPAIDSSGFGDTSDVMTEQDELSLEDGDVGTLVERPVGGLTEREEPGSTGVMSPNDANTSDVDMVHNDPATLDDNRQLDTTAVSANLVASSSGRHLRKRTRKIILDDEDCFDCGKVVESDSTDASIIRCMGPGCSSVAHLRCLGMLEEPKEAWFCDDDCKSNAGLRTKRRRT